MRFAMAPWPREVLAMTNYVCPDCGYVYRESEGDAHEGYPPGTAFASLPEDFVCPDCAVRSKEDFVEQQTGPAK